MVYNLKKNTVFIHFCVKMVKVFEHLTTSRNNCSKACYHVKSFKQMKTPFQSNIDSFYMLK